MQETDWVLRNEFKIVGLEGGRGNEMVELMRQQDKNGICLSLKDFYEGETHDLDLMRGCIVSLMVHDETDIPVQEGDRKNFRRVKGNFDHIIVEGWCHGSKSVTRQLVRQRDLIFSLFDACIVVPEACDGMATYCLPTVLYDSAMPVFRSSERVL